MRFSQKSRQHVLGGTDDVERLVDGNDVAIKAWRFQKLSNVRLVGRKPPRRISPDANLLLTPTFRI